MKLLMFLCFLLFYLFADSKQHVDYSVYLKVAESGKKLTWHDKQYNDLIMEYQVTVNNAGGLDHVSKSVRGRFIIMKLCVGAIGSMTDLCQCATNKIEKEYFVDEADIDWLMQDYIDNKKVYEKLVLDINKYIDECFLETNSTIQIQR